MRRGHPGISVAAHKATVSSKFRERTELLDFLLEVSSITAQTLDLDVLLRNVDEVIRRVIAYDLLAIFLYDAKKKELRIRHAVGHREEIVNYLSIRLGEGIVGAAAAERDAVLVADVTLDDRYLQTSDVVRCEMAIPMIARNRLVGVIDLQATKPGAFKDYDRSMLSLVASRVAAAIDNAQLYRRAERQYKTIRTLSKISSEFSSILEIDELLSKVASSVRGLLPYDAFSILLVDERQQVLKHRFSIRYDQRVDIDNVPLGLGITGAAVASKEAVRVDDTSQDARYIATHPGVFSEIAVPLVLQDKVIGVMDLESEKLRFFTEDHARTLTLLAPSVAIAVENARLYQEIGERERLLQQDLRAAFELQQVLLPAEAPPIEGLNIAIGLRPAREISGDLYDFFSHSESHALIAFGDSSGKGLAAALYGAMVNGLMRTLAPRWRSVSTLMKALNDALVQRKVEGRYLTLILVAWQRHSRRFTMSNAGGSPPMVVRGNEVMRLQVEGVPLGLLPDRDYDELVFDAQPGDLLVLFSDGVSEHQNPEADEYGRAKLALILRDNAAATPKEVVAAIFKDLDEFHLARFDDQTVIAMRVE